jgi:C-terminal processing protease CtpA/Prc
MKRGDATKFLFAAGLIGSSLAFPFPSQSTANEVDSSQRMSQAYQKAWLLVRDNYFPPVDRRQWQHWQHAFDGQLHNRQQLFRAISTMMSALNDDYSYLMTQRNKQEHRRLVHDRHSVRANMLSDCTGYISLSSFESNDMVEQFRQAMETLSGAQAFILDLRNNHGGYIENARGIFAMLTISGEFMSYEGLSNGQRDAHHLKLRPSAWEVSDNGRVRLQPRDANLAADKPLVILVNHDTRSAAELLAGALRESGRAMLIGDTTFGKGVLQDTFSVGTGINLKLVTARYYLPDGDTPQHKGLVPDVVMKNGCLTDVDNQLHEALLFTNWAVSLRQQAHQQSMALQ